MTENKTLKRRVRERMSKTGERYTAARRQVLLKSADKAPDQPQAEAEPLHGPTNRTWAEWVAVLDDWGARDKPHPEIARWLGEKQGVPPWWTQDITVRYERHIGRRALRQRGSTFSATGTKTISAPATKAFEAWMDEGVRATWLPDVELRLRSSRSVGSTKYPTSRFEVPGEGRVIVSYESKGESRTVVAIEHEKLPDAEAAARWSKFWRSRLTELKKLLES